MEQSKIIDTTEAYQYTFYTKAKDMDSDYHNSRVIIQCVTDANGTTERFYERVEDICELD